VHDESEEGEGVHRGEEWRRHEDLTHSVQNFLKTSDEPATSVVYILIRIGSSFLNEAQNDHTHTLVELCVSRLSVSADRCRNFMNLAPRQRLDAFAAERATLVTPPPPPAHAAAAHAGLWPPQNSSSSNSAATASTLQSQMRELRDAFGPPRFLPAFASAATASLPPSAALPIALSHMPVRVAHDAFRRQPPAGVPALNLARAALMLAGRDEPPHAHPVLIDHRQQRAVAESARSIGEARDLLRNYDFMPQVCLVFIRSILLVFLSFLKRLA
jgi:hypothetical protein